MKVTKLYKIIHKNITMTWVDFNSNLTVSGLAFETFKIKVLMFFKILIIKLIKDISSCLISLTVVTGGFYPEYNGRITISLEVPRNCVHWSHIIISTCLILC